MESIAEETIRTYIGPLLHPGLLLAAAVTIVVLVSGIAARILEFAQSTIQAITGGDVGTGPSPLSPQLIVHDAQNGER